MDRVSSRLLSLNANGNKLLASASGRVEASKGIMLNGSNEAIVALADHAHNGCNRSRAAHGIGKSRR